MLPVLLCAAGLGGCLVAEHLRSQRGLWVAKPIASAAFVWAAFSWGATESSFGAWLAAGLVACALGDLLLIAKDAPRALQAGMLAFGVGHLLFSAAFVGHGLVPAAALTGAAVALGLAAWVWRWLRPQLGPDDRRAVLGYLIVIAAMLSCALGAAAAGAPASAAAGAALFAISDLAVARDRFVARSFASTLWGLPAYYAAQLLLAAGAASP